jgi:hypothetical protein
MLFAWDEWNLGHIDRHGVTQAEAEYAFESLTINEWAELREHDRIIYVVHAMELSPAMKQLYRKRRKTSWR